MAQAKSGQSFPGGPGGAESSGRSVATQKGLCFAFNEGNCKFGSKCKFKHECTSCGGTHGANRCFKSKDGSSVNDGIDPVLCSVVYASFDTALSWVRRCGQGALLAKTDIESAFRLLPVHPDMGSFPELGARGGRGRDSVADGIVAAASRAVNDLIGSAMVSGTWGLYERSWKLWEDWQEFLGGGVDDMEMSLLLFVGHCKELGWSVAKLDGCMAGLAFGFRRRGLRDWTKSFLVRLALRGWRRGVTKEDDRKPISFSLLVQIGGVMESICFSRFELRLFRVAFSLAFFGALRLGELVSRSTTKAGGILFEDVDLYRDRVDIRLRRSKIDQTGRGAIIRLFEVQGCIMCPVLCVKDFLELRRDDFGPLLIHSNGSFLSCFQFQGVLRHCLSKLGLNTKGFSGHCFRIGAATEAARRGLGEDVIHRIGRWESRRFRSYVRLDRC
ncbi:integrase/recombinase xerD homolog [Leptodactylus fuscus]|uniref:integrase/recombinase xerD homolog n=1 Tax=Leptodactylus fuscus TaxID=238119 RepID=UPI003F4EE206